jgi:hypothetical protein
MALTFYGPAFQRVHLMSGLVTLLMRSYNPPDRWSTFTPRCISPTQLRHQRANVDYKQVARDRSTATPATQQPSRPSGATHTTNSPRIRLNHQKFPHPDGHGPLWSASAHRNELLSAYRWQIHRSQFRRNQCNRTPLTECIQSHGHRHRIG